MIGTLSWRWSRKVRLSNLILHNLTQPKSLLSIFDYFGKFSFFLHEYLLKFIHFLYFLSISYIFKLSLPQLKLKHQLHTLDGHQILCWKNNFEFFILWCFFGFWISDISTKIDSWSYNHTCLCTCTCYCTWTSPYTCTCLVIVLEGKRLSKVIITSEHFKYIIYWHPSR